ncbi:zinc-finger family protein [Escherichia coli PA11]|nr:zinc-finger family protein [Escherichia coli PA11]
MFGIFKKKTRRAAAEIKKFEKRDLAQAVINAAYLVAYADGECEASEKAKIEQVLRNQPALSAFTSEINAISATIIGQLDTNFKIGRRAALREIEDVKHDTREAEDVLDVAVAIAEADGEIEPEERKVLEEIAGVLGLRLENTCDGKTAPAVAALLLFLVVMVDFTSRIMSVLADGVLVCGIVVLLWPVIKRNSLHNA